MNFGFDQDRNWHPRSSNYRMSDLSAAFIYDHIERNFQKIIKHSIMLEDVFDQVCKRNNWKKMQNTSDGNCLLNSLVFFTEEKNIKNLNIFEWKKYYKPLSSQPIADKLFDNVICLPCHCEVTVNNILQLIK